MSVDCGRRLRGSIGGRTDIPGRPWRWELGVSDNQAQYIENKDGNPDKPHHMAVIRCIAKAKLVYHRIILPEHD